LDDTSQDATTDADVSGEWALLVDVLAVESLDAWAKIAGKND
jgi:hypothetical protein